MSDEEKESNVKSIIDATTGLVKAIPIYDDLVQPAAKELGKALGTVAKTVNIALLPVSGMIWSYETIKDFVTLNVSEKLKNIPPENIETPSPVVAGPALEALKYAGHEEILRNMYANLLANALDKGTKNDTHPSFVELIKQLSPLEAKMLLVMSQQKQYPKVCSTQNQQRISGGWGGSLNGNGFTSNQVKSQFIKLCDKFNIDVDAGSALDNYLRLKIIDVESNTTYRINNNNDFFTHDSDDLSEKLELSITNSEQLLFTEYGIKFINTCVKDKT